MIDIQFQYLVFLMPISLKISLNCRYTMFLFTKQREELAGLYASKLARHRCIDIFVHMMELRLNARFASSSFFFGFLLCTSWSNIILHAKSFSLVFHLFLDTVSESLINTCHGLWYFFPINFGITML